MSTATKLQLVSLLNALESWEAANRVGSPQWKRLEVLQSIITHSQGLDLDWCSRCGGSGNCAPDRPYGNKDPQEWVDCDCAEQYGIVQTS